MRLELLYPTHYDGLQEQSAMLSATNISGRGINAGAPVIVTGKTVRLAGPTEEPTGIATSGAIQGGVVTVETSGDVDLPSWKMATGTQYLTPGATYRISAIGRIAIGKTGKIVGIASGRTKLTLQIYAEIASSAYTVIQGPPGNDGTSGSILYTVTDVPSSYLGNVGDFSLDTTHMNLYGPKTVFGWGSPAHLGAVVNGDDGNLYSITVSVVNGIPTFVPTLVP